MPLNDNHEESKYTGKQPEKDEKRPEGVTDVLTVKNWLISHISQALDIEPKEIDVEQDLTEYGLNSIEMVNISGALEDYLGCRLDPTIVLEYPTIEALSDYLSKDVERSSSQPPQSAQAAQKMLENLDEMSDEDVDKLLKAMMTDEGATQTRLNDDE